MKQTILFKHPAPVFREELKSDFDLVDFDLETGTPDDAVRQNANALPMLTMLTQPSATRGRKRMSR